MIVGATKAPTLPSCTARKPSFIPAHPLHAKFARLTQQEEKAGLLQARGQGSSVQEPCRPSSIGTRIGWLARLEEKGLALRGHRLVRSVVGSQRSEVC